MGVRLTLCYMIFVIGNKNYKTYNNYRSIVLFVKLKGDKKRNWGIFLTPKLQKKPHCTKD